MLKRSTKPEAKEILKSVTSTEVSVKEEPMETEPDTLCDQLNLLFSKDSSEVLKSVSFASLLVCSSIPSWLLSWGTGVIIYFSLIRLG